jgi:hypothetical protein
VSKSRHPSSCPTDVRSLVHCYCYALRSPFRQMRLFDATGSNNPGTSLLCGDCNGKAKSQPNHDTIGVAACKCPLGLISILADHARADPASFRCAVICRPCSIAPPIIQTSRLRTYLAWVWMNFFRGGT